MGRRVQRQIANRGRIPEAWDGAPPCAPGSRAIRYVRMRQGDAARGGRAKHEVLVGTHPIYVRSPDARLGGLADTAREFETSGSLSQAANCTKRVVQIQLLQFLVLSFALSLALALAKATSFPLAALALALTATFAFALSSFESKSNQGFPGTRNSCSSYVCYEVIFNRNISCQEAENKMPFYQHPT